MGPDPSTANGLSLATMGMTKCWECKGSVSSRAKACPHCGARKPGDLKAAVALGGIANALMGIGCLLTPLLFMVGAIAAC